jgi:hypothetical protein
MKKILFFSILFIFLLALKVNAQSSNQGTQLSTRIANKMKDSLQLSNSQRNQVFAVNMYIHNRKQIVRQMTTNTDSLRTKLQHIESGRDSMYQRILPVLKYQLYLQKKRNLISSN